MRLHQRGLKNLLKNKTVTMTDIQTVLEFNDAKHEISDTLKEICSECSLYQKMIVIADCGDDGGIVAYRCGYSDEEVVFELERLKMRTLAMNDQNDCEGCSE